MDELFCVCLTLVFNKFMNASNCLSLKVRFHGRDVVRVLFLKNKSMGVISLVLSRFGHGFDLMREGRDAGGLLHTLDAGLE